jgi:hypothetical protein
MRKAVKLRTLIDEEETEIRKLAASRKAAYRLVQRAKAIVAMLDDPIKIVARIPRVRFKWIYGEGRKGARMGIFRGIQIGGRWMRVIYCQSGIMKWRVSRPLKAIPVATERQAIGRRSRLSRLPDNHQASA